MRRENKVYFAPDYTFVEFLNSKDPIEIIEKYRDRINGFYLEPVRHLMSSNDDNYAFITGLICFSAIDAIARTVTGSSKSKERFLAWIKYNLPDFKTLNSKYLDRIYDEYRCGLVHEARIKNGGQFTYQIDSAIEIHSQIIYVNPRILLKQIQTAFNSIIDDVKADEKRIDRFCKLIKDDFEVDLCFVEDEICLYCLGTGEWEGMICPNCGGSGIKEGGYLNLSIDNLRTNP